MQYKILFVDDEEFLLSSIERELRNKFDIETCTNAYEAVERIKRQIYSVIVADYQMPGMNGVEFLAAAKDITPASIRILFTGNADLNTAISAVNEGHIFKFLSKPYLIQELTTVLRQALGQFKLLMKAEQNEFMALHDNLTGLPNRVFLLQKLKDAAALAKRFETMAAVLFLDLDGFKAVNDKYGHETGDKLLQYAAQILLGSIREIDTAARVGGDEFVVVLQSLTKGSDAGISAARIIDALSKSVKIDTNICSISASIGISLFPSDAEDVQTLIKNADNAMYEAKKRGGSSYFFYCDITGIQK